MVQVKQPTGDFPVVDARLLRAIQHRTARAAIGSSSMRGAGSTGVVAAARGFLGGLNLAPFGTADAAAFAAHLGRATEHLRAELPRSARHWGLARKGLNIFLRDCLYTIYLRQRYHLELAESFFEVPLDSICAKRLAQESGGVLPRWPGVRALDKQTSRLYQLEATAAALRGSHARVHLDAMWWGAREQGEAAESV